MVQMLLVAFGGAVGSVLRYYVGVSALRIAGLAFPWGTLTVNLVGCFLIGLLSEMINRIYGGSIELRLLLITGFLGGFTTFSAFSLDTVGLIERADWAAAVTYVAASVMVSLVATFAGLIVVRALT